jgi:DNA polymerase III sliding clamp (beta) subunit (PCNA family)
MKIDRKKFLNGLNIALKITPKGSSLPILKTVKIDGPGQKLVATDLDTAVVIPMKIKDYRVSLGEEEPEKIELPTKKADLVAKAEELGLTVTKKSTVASLKEEITKALPKAKPSEKFHEEVFCLNAADLKKIVGSLEHDTIEIAVSKSEQKDLLGATLVSVGGHFQDLPMAEADGFPLLIEEEVSEKKKTVISPKILQHIITATISEDSGFKLSYVFFDANGKKAVATDGHRLHYSKVKTSDSWFLEAGAAKAITCVAPKDQDIVFMLNEKGTQAVCEFEDTKFIMVVQDAKFPDYEAVMGKPKHEVTVKKDDVEKYLKQAILMVDTTFRGMKLTFDGSIGVEVRNPEKGSYTRTDIPLQKGKVDPQVVVGLNGNYFIDAVRTAEGEDAIVSIGVTDEKSPVYFKHGDFNALVMPMRL